MVKPPEWQKKDGKSPCGLPPFCMYISKGILMPQKRPLINCGRILLKSSKNFSKIQNTFIKADFGCLTILLFDEILFVYIFKLSCLYVETDTYIMPTVSVKPSPKVFTSWYGIIRNNWGISKFFVLKICKSVSKTYLCGIKLTIPLM